MKNIFHLLLLFVIPLSAFGQKMKFKQRQIFFDQEVAYKFYKLAGKSLGEFQAFAMISAAGDTLLTFEPKLLYFDRLPFEKEATYFSVYNQMKLHETGASVAVDYSPIGLPYQVFQYLKKTKMLTVDSLDYHQLAPFVALMGSAQPTIDIHRRENQNRRFRYAATVAKYGEGAYVSREGGAVVLFKDRIQINKVDIGNWTETSKHRGRVSYLVKNMQGDNIAQLHLKLAKNEIIVLSVVGGERHELDFIPTVLATEPTDLIKKAAEKLVELGNL